MTSDFFRKWVGEETSLVLPSLPQFSRTMPIFSCTSFQKPKYNSADHLQIFLAPEPTLYATTSSINHKTFCMPAGTNHPNYRLLFREASTVQKYRGLKQKKKVLLQRKRYRTDYKRSYIGNRQLLSGAKEDRDAPKNRETQTRGEQGRGSHLGGFSWGQWGPLPCHFWHRGEADRHRWSQMVLQN